MTDIKKSKGTSDVHRRQFVGAGSVIIREGELGVTAFLIQSGSVAVTVTDSKTGKPVQVATLGAGQIFGEMALITSTTRTATVTAAQDCNLIQITRDQLEEKLKKSDPTIRALVPMLMKRLGKTNETLVRQEQTVEDMIVAVKAMYENAAAPLVPSKKKSLENLVKPQMNAFIQALEAYDDRYGD